MRGYVADHLDAMQQAGCGAHAGLRSGNETRELVAALPPHVLPQLSAAEERVELLLTPSFGLGWSGR